MARHRVARVEDLPEDSMRRVVVEGQEICLAHCEDGGFYAIGDVCTHEDYPLSDGVLWGQDVECPQHGSRFNLKTGRVTGLPAVVPARTYEVTVDDGDVYVEV